MVIFIYTVLIAHRSIFTSGPIESCYTVTCIYCCFVYILCVSYLQLNGFAVLNAVARHSPVCILYMCADLSLVRFISAELTRGYFLEHNEAKYTERRERVYTCLRIPKELEKVPNTAACYQSTEGNMQEYIDKTSYEKYI